MRGLSIPAGQRGADAACLLDLRMVNGGGPIFRETRVSPLCLHMRRVCIGTFVAYMRSCGEKQARGSSAYTNSARSSPPPQAATHMGGMG